jgi:signal peptidase I
MQPPRRHPLRVAFTLSLIAVLWLLFAPIAIGGQVAYVIINGNSMEPGMRRGDLAILRQASSYAVGDVVTYRHPEIGPVIHRIIAREEARFVFQGDNNNFIDPYQPHADELIGRLWLHIPRVGTALAFLRQPPVFALLVVLTLGSVTMSTGQLPLKARRRRAASPAAQPMASFERAALLNHGLTALLVLGLGALALGALAFSRPLSQLVNASINFTQHAEFAYSAAAPAGLYDAPHVHTGDPVFRRVSDTVAVTVNYRFAGAHPRALSGSAQLQLELSDGAGWRRTMPLGPSTPFSGDAISLDGTLSFAALQQLIDHFEAQSGTTRSSYNLAIIPQVQINGSLAGEPLAEAFAPRMEFVIDAQRLRPAQPATPALVTQNGSLSSVREQPARLQLWLLDLEVLTARRLALAGLEIALVGGLLVAWALARELRRDPQAAIRLRYGPLLVRASDPEPWAGEACELPSIADLARLAERLAQPIFVVEQETTLAYYVRDGERLYRVSLPGAN